jgi:hypothetical protein
MAFALSAQIWSHAVSLTPHYVYLAYSLLQRHVDLVQLPPTTYDLLHFNGRWFVAGSPMPALMMLPWVAIFGIGFSDVLFSVILGALDVAVVYSLLGTFISRGATETRRTAGETSRLCASLAISESARRWITLLFALGTPFWYLASLGTYWFTAHIVAVFFALLATREALTRQRWFLAGLWLAGAGLARPTALFLTPFFLAIMIYATRHTEHQQRMAHDLLRSAALLGAALALGLAAHFAYNYARFKSLADFGYAYVTGADNITNVYARFGGFNPRFAPCNLAVSLLLPPEVNGATPAFITQSCAHLLGDVNLADTSALITPNPLGMSIFLVTPALLIVFAPLGASLRRRLVPAPSSFDSSSLGSRPVRRAASGARPAGWAPIVFAAWLGLLATLIPLWLYHNTGSLQFGWRYLFDAAPMWIILLAAGMQPVTTLKRGLILVSVAINAWGFLWMFEKLNGMSWWNF